MSNNLKDRRDRTIFIEFYPEFVLTSVWYDNGKLDSFAVEPCQG